MMKVSALKDWTTMAENYLNLRFFCIKSVTKATFQSHFEKYGEITDLYMPKDQGSTTHRGIGFITLASAESVDSLMADTHKLGGSTVVVDRATPKDLFDVDFDEHPQLRDIVHHYFF
ncbi:hypothetical protein TIFTF001_050456 [Ficus carica]|uniref:RRM domain-containing protein n=1 Tax=Ficus carica TaxID=3494 RepID=A0AA87ZGR8_FICCA|nr:hypothetical protein TIFTF001_050456 [Ficus carica]